MTQNVLDLTVIILCRSLTPKLQRAVTSATWATSILLIQDSGEKKLQPSQFSVPVTIRQHSLESDWAAQRNWALEQVQTEWSLFLDDDEWIPAELAREIQEVVASANFAAYTLPRRDFFLGKLLQHGDTGTSTFIRLAKTVSGRKMWQRAQHEQWRVTGLVGHLRNPILHEPAESISHFLQKLSGYSVLEAKIRQPLSQGVVLVMLLTFPAAKFLKGYVWQHGWRDGFPGLAHAVCMALFSLMVRVQCWEAWYGHTKC